MALNIQILRTLYPHWGKYSGICQFISYVDEKKFNLVINNIPYIESFPMQNTEAINWLRKIVKKYGQLEWYNLNDLRAELNTLLRCLIKKIDIIHYLDGEHSAQFLPLVLKRIGQKRPKIIATYHQPPEVLDKLNIKQVLPYVDLITVVSSDQESYFKKLLDADKIRLILHGINTDFFKPGVIKENDGKVKCITVGSNHRDFETFKYVAQILSDFTDIEFALVSSDAYELNSLKNVTVYKCIDDSNLLRLYQQSDILFLPLLKATANNTILEGLACGLPIVSTCLPAIKNYLAGKEAILIRDNDPKEFANAILDLANNPEKCKTMSLEARKRAEELDWKNMTPKYEEIYHYLLN